MRFVALDGLRGVAALLVVLYHALSLTYGIDWFRGGYLAVDFFFMLSGLVVARAYEPKLQEGLELPAFLRIRAVRLYPTIAAGVLAGGVALLATGYSPGASLVLTLAGLLFVPLLNDKGQGVFPANGPQWSLFLEVVANVLHALVLWRLSVKALAWIAGVAFALLCLASWHHGSMAIGHIGDRFVAGFPRVLFGYTTGILLYRLSDRLPALNWRPWMLFAALPVLLLLSGLVRHWAAGPITILFFPVILIAGMRVRGGEASRLLGMLSYPLYAIHFPAITLALLLDWPKAVGLLTAIGLAVAFGCLLAVVVEPKRTLAPS